LPRNVNEDLWDFDYGSARDYKRMVQKWFNMDTNSTEVSPIEDEG
jgi:hypothetical protein